MPTSRWKIDVLSEAERLDRELTRVEANHDNASRRESVMEALASARAIACDRSGPRQWWAGSSVEASSRLIQQAREELTLLQDPEALLAQVPDLQRVVERWPEDPETDNYSHALDEWAGGVTPAPEIVRHIYVREHRWSNAGLEEVRRFRNLLIVSTAAVTALVVALWQVGVTYGSVIGLGALGGAVSIVFALRSGLITAPYNVAIPQSLIKIPMGAATALAAVLVLTLGSTSPDLAHANFYAVIFGFSQQAFTRLIDDKASALASRAQLGGLRSPLP